MLKRMKLTLRSTIEAKKALLDLICIWLLLSLWSCSTSSGSTAEQTPGDGTNPLTSPGSELLRELDCPWIPSDRKIPIPNSAYYAVVVDSTLYFSGSSGGTNEDYLKSINLDTCEHKGLRSTFLSSSFGGSEYIHINGSIYYFGVFDFVRYDIASNQWHEHKYAPGVRLLKASVIGNNNTIYRFGGVDSDQKRQGTVWAYNTTFMTWNSTQVPSHPFPIENANIQKVNNSIITWCGTPECKTTIYDISQGTWRILDDAHANPEELFLKHCNNDVQPVFWKGKILCEFSQFDVQKEQWSSFDLPEVPSEVMQGVEHDSQNRGFLFTTSNALYHASNLRPTEFTDPPQSFLYIQRIDTAE